MDPEILQAIRITVEEAVDTKINGKLVGIKNQLNEQDKAFIEMKELLAERKFLIQLWSFVKFLGGVAVSTGGAYLLFKKLK